MTDRTCARCGHQGFLGGTIGNQHYCHSFMASPTCYEQESREQAMITNPRTGEREHRSLSRDELDQLLDAQDKIDAIKRAEEDR